MFREVTHEHGDLHVPWYSLNPRNIRVRNLLPILIFFLLLTFVNEKHLWQWDWEHGYHAHFNCHAVKDSHARNVEAWRWVEGKEIRVYFTPTMKQKATRFAAYNVQKLAEELGLELNAHAMPMPTRVTEALARSSATDGTTTTVNFDRFCREMVASRDGHYAEIVYTTAKIDASADVVGAAVFNYGVSLIDPRRATASTVRHETAHLLGYHLHDDWPLVILGYSNPQWAKYQVKHNENPPLMMPWDSGFDLSPRAHDALIHFWHGLEQRTGKRYFKD